MDNISEHKLLKYDRKRLFLYAFVVLLPFLAVVTVLILNGYGSDFSILVPLQHDEIMWWDQVNTMIRCGKPLGYYGFNGSHAEVGTWCSWGWAPIVPYAIFGKIFGWDFYSMCIANVTFLSLSTAVFLVLTKPDIKQTILLALVHISSYLTLRYSLTPMSEGLRYSLGIILIGLFIWLERRTKNKETSLRDIILYIFLAVFIFYSIMIYLIFALVIPMFCLCLCRRLKLLPRLGISAAATAVTAVGANYLVSLFSSPYLTNTIGSIIDTVKNDGLFKGMSYMFNSFSMNISTLSPPAMAEHEGILFWFFLLYIILLIYLLIRAANYITEKYTNNIKGIDEDNIKFLTALYLMMGFLFGYCILYDGTDTILSRGINTGLIMVLLCLIFADIKKTRNIYIILAVYFVLSSVSAWKKYDDMLEARQLAASYLSSIEEEQERLEQIMVISDENDTWGNTIAQYGMLDSRYLVMPTGAGLQFMRDNKVNERAPYAVITAGSEYQDIYLEILTDSGHEIIYEDELFIILKNTLYYTDPHN